MSRFPARITGAISVAVIVALGAVGTAFAGDRIPVSSVPSPCFVS